MLEHGGRLREAAARYGIPLEQWLDLSTGINPVAYPLPSVPPAAWQRLPEEDDGLEQAARLAYGVGPGASVLAVAGSQAAIQGLPQVLLRQRGAPAVGLALPCYGEYGEAWRRADWQNLDALTARQISGAHQGTAFLPPLAVDANRAWSSQAFLSPNLLRENLLLRLSYDDSEGFKPYLEALYTPRDGGRVLTLAANWETDRHRFTLGLRQFGGPGDAAYARAPAKGLLWAQWTWAVF